MKCYGVVILGLGLILVVASDTMCMFGSASDSAFRSSPFWYSKSKCSASTVVEIRNEVLWPKAEAPAL